MLEPQKFGVLVETHQSINTLWEKMISSPTNVSCR